MIYIYIYICMKIGSVCGVVVRPLCGLHITGRGWHTPWYAGWMNGEGERCGLLCKCRWLLGETSPE